MENNAKKCLDCSLDAEPYRKRCHKCLEKQRKGRKKFVKENPSNVAAANKKYRENLIGTKRCPRCSSPLREEDEGYTLCINCRERAGLRRLYICA